jgi:hypothetical protein
MADQVLVYISAAADLAFEREVLNRAIAEIPTSLAWRILQTPLTSEEPDLQALAESDVHLLLLGSDVRAPIGVEWLAARRSGQLPTLFLKSGNARTQAAHAFMHELERYTRWHHFAYPADLRKQVLTLLGEHLLAQHEHYRLAENEHAKLRTWLQALKKAKRQKVNDTRGGAGNSSIILSTERYVPSEGVLLHAPDKPEDE